MGFELGLHDDNVVGTFAAVEYIFAIAAMKRVIALAALERVISAFAVDGIVASTAGNPAAFRRGGIGVSIGNIDADVLNGMLAIAVSDRTAIVWLVSAS